MDISERLEITFKVVPERRKVEHTLSWLYLSKDYEIKTVYAETMVIISHLHTLLKRFQLIGTYSYKNGQSIYIQDSRIIALTEQEQRRHFDEITLQADIFNFLKFRLLRTGIMKILMQDICTSGNVRTAIRRQELTDGIKEVACELFGYELNQPPDRCFSLDIARTLTASGWSKTGKKLWLNTIPSDFGMSIFVCL